MPPGAGCRQFHAAVAQSRGQPPAPAGPGEPDVAQVDRVLGAGFQRVRPPRPGLAVVRHGGELQRRGDGDHLAAGDRRDQVLEDQVEQRLRGRGLRRVERDHRLPLGQHQAELAEGAVQPITLPADPHLVAVAGGPVAVVGGVGRDLAASGLGDVLGGNQLAALPRPAQPVQLAEPGQLGGGDMQAGEAELASLLVGLPARLDAERLEQPRSQVVHQGLAGASPHQLAEHPAGEVVVGVPGADRLLGHRAEEVVDRVLAVVPVGVGAVPGGHAQQVVDGDLRDPRVHRPVRVDQGRHPVVQAEPALTDRDPHRRAGDRFAHRVDAHAVGGAPRLPVGLDHRTAAVQCDHGVQLDARVGLDRRQEPAEVLAHAPQPTDPGPAGSAQRARTPPRRLTGRTDWRARPARAGSGGGARPGRSAPPAARNCGRTAC